MILQAASKGFFQVLAGSRTLKALSSRYGMRDRRSFARRFIAGENVEDAFDAARQIQASGLMVTLDFLGESVASIAEADAATRAYINVLERIAAAGIERNISLKLTQLGLTVDRATCVDNLRRILDGAAPHDFFVRLDMEDSRYTQVTFDIFETLWQLGYRNIGITVQAYLPRTTTDVRRLIALGARMRLVKGSYREPRRIAYQKKEQVDAAFIEIMQLLLTEGVQPAIATHDPAMLAAIARFAAARSIAPARYELQLVYGVRRDLQARLAGEGFRVRIDVPFGREWFPYVMRRLGERPASVRLVVRSLMRDQ